MPVRRPLTLAAKLANGVFIAVHRYVDEIARTDATNPEHRVTVRQLGAAGAATVHSGASKAVMALAFLAVLIFGCLAIIATAAVRQRGAAVDEAVDRFGYPPAHPSEDVDAPSPALPKIRAGGWR